MDEDEKRIHALQRARDRAALTGSAADAKAAELALAEAMRNVRFGGPPGLGGACALSPDHFPRSTSTGRRGVPPGGDS